MTRAVDVLVTTERVGYRGVDGGFHYAGFLETVQTDPLTAWSLCSSGRARAIDAVQAAAAICEVLNRRIEWKRRELRGEFRRR